MLCIHCGKENDEDSKFCLSCGTHLKQNDCKQCGRVNDMASKFCLGCGSNLKPQEVKVVVTPPPSVNVVVTPPPSVNEVVTPPLDNEDLSTRPLVFASLACKEDGSQMVLPLKPIISIGRVDPKAKNFPDIDLTKLDKDKSVSRQHAHILFTGGKFYLEDLGSVNKTLLNQVECEAHKEYPLNDGDAFSLGKLNFTFHVNE
jgi:hypothetical protein